VSASFFRISS